MRASSASTAPPATKQISAGEFSPASGSRLKRDEGGPAPMQSNRVLARYQAALPEPNAAMGPARRRPWSRRSTIDQHAPGVDRTRELDRAVYGAREAERAIVVAVADQQHKLAFAARQRNAYRVTRQGLAGAAFTVIGIAWSEDRAGSHRCHRSTDWRHPHRTAGHTVDFSHEAEARIDRESARVRGRRHVAKRPGP